MLMGIGVQWQTKKSHVAPLLPVTVLLCEQSYVSRSTRLILIQVHSIVCNENMIIAKEKRHLHKFAHLCETKQQHIDLSRCVPHF